MRAFPILSSYGEVSFALGVTESRWGLTAGNHYGEGE